MTTFVSMCLLSVPLTALSVAMVCIMLVVTTKCSTLSGSYFAAQQHDLGEVDGFIEEMMDGQKAVQVFCHEDEARADFHAVNDRLRESSTRANLVSNIIMPINANIGNISYVAVCAAGAAMADPPALILDEATSSIDTRTEEIVAAGMDALMAGRTTFVIAHRLSTVKNADCICVMEHGHIVERGSHDELMAQRGRYWQLYTGGLEDD